LRVGILGGTFDPPHAGHLALAHAALVALELDEVMLLPVSRNPLKTEKRQTSPKQRMEMLKLAAKDEPKLAISDIEIVRGGPSYAVETLQELSYVQEADYWFLLGSDALREIARWKAPEKLLRLCRLGVVMRNAQERSQLLAILPPYVDNRIDWIEMPLVKISSTDLRERLRFGRDTSPWLKPEVKRYIDDNKLYRS
jgi:nicotinate-nucleotide adenylyltransferase